MIETTERLSAAKLGSRLAHRVWHTALNSAAGPLVERALVSGSHLFPYRSWPGQGAAIGEISRRRSGQAVIAVLTGGVRIVVPAIPEGVALYVKGAYVEAETVRLFERFWRPGHVFFDVGANMGLYAFLAARACSPGGQVHAFEPQSPLVACLEQSLALNCGGAAVTITAAAVSNTHDAEAVLYHAVDRQGTGIPSLLRHEWLDATSGIRVPTVSIDGYRQDNGIGRIDAMKIDVEGAEMLALAGMHGTLRQAPPDLLVIEVLPERLSFDSIQGSVPLQHAPLAAVPGRVLELLAGYGYQPRRIEPDGRLGAICSEAALAALTWSTNLAFVRARVALTRPEIFAPAIEHRSQHWGRLFRGAASQ